MVRAHFEVLTSKVQSEVPSKDSSDLPMRYNSGFPLRYTSDFTQRFHTTRFIQRVSHNLIRATCFPEKSEGSVSPWTNPTPHGLSPAWRSGSRSNQAWGVCDGGRTRGEGSGDLSPRVPNLQRQTRYVLFNCCLNEMHEETRVETHCE